MATILPMGEEQKPPLDRTGACQQQWRGILADPLKQPPTRGVPLSHIKFSLREILIAQLGVAVMSHHPLRGTSPNESVSTRKNLYAGNYFQGCAGNYYFQKRDKRFLHVIRSHGFPRITIPNHCPSVNHCKTTV